LLPGLAADADVNMSAYLATSTRFNSPTALLKYPADGLTAAFRQPFP
jgi:hypothetical protein